QETPRETLKILAIVIGLMAMPYVSAQIWSPRSWPLAMALFVWLLLWLLLMMRMIHEWWIREVAGYLVIVAFAIMIYYSPPNMFQIGFLLQALSAAIWGTADHR